MFLKCAKEAKADYLVSNDTKSGMHELSGTFGTTIITAEEFVKIMKK